MDLFFTVQVLPNYVGVVFRNNKFFKVFSPGKYELYTGLFIRVDFKRILLPTTPQVYHVMDQEMLSNEKLNLVVNYSVSYRIDDYEKFVNSFDVFRVDEYSNRLPLNHFEDIFKLESSRFIRKEVGQLSVNDIRSNQDQIFKKVFEFCHDGFKKMGINIISIDLEDLYYPAEVQQALVHTLESSTKVKSDLNNAKMILETAKTLEEASQIVRKIDDKKMLSLLSSLGNVLSQPQNIDEQGEEPSGQTIEAKAKEQKRRRRK